MRASAKPEGRPEPGEGRSGSAAGTCRDFALLFMERACLGFAARFDHRIPS